MPTRPSRRPGSCRLSLPGAALRIGPREIPEIALTAEARAEQEKIFTRAFASDVSGLTPVTFPSAGKALVLP
jgi:hypothetical protein